MSARSEWMKDHYRRNPDAYQRNLDLKRGYRDRTTAKATRRGAEWTTAELNAVSSSTKPLVELAVELGRTYQAVAHKHAQLRRATA